MKESIATIAASENRGSLRANATSRNMFNLATGLVASVFLLSSGADYNKASMAVIRDIGSYQDAERERTKLEEALQSRHNELSYSRKGDQFTVALR